VSVTLALGAMEDQRAMLAALMAGSSGADGKCQQWWDEDVCKKFLVWECPHDYFVNQKGRSIAKGPLRECQYLHADSIKEAFREDKDSDKYTRRYLQELEKFLRQQVEGLNVKRDRDTDKLSRGESCTIDAQAFVKTEIETRSTLVKDKLLAAEEMAASGDVDVSKSVYNECTQLAHEQRRLERIKEMTDSWIDEICEDCGQYISWRGAEEVQRKKDGRAHSHCMGIVHTGWVKMRESLKRIQVELDKIGRSEDPDKIGTDPSRRNERRERDGRKDDTDRERRDSDRGRGDRRNSDDRVRNDRDRDTRGYRDDRDDRRHGSGRDRERGQDKKDDRDRKREEYDEFGRSKNKVHIPFKEEAERRTGTDRSRSRENTHRGKGSDLQPNTSEQEVADAKIVLVEYSDDWQEVMSEKFEALGLEMELWDMTAYDCKGKKVDLNAEVVEICLESFPLKFKFAHK